MVRQTRNGFHNPLPWIHGWDLFVEILPLPWTLIVIPKIHMVETQHFSHPGNTFPSVRGLLDGWSSPPNTTPIWQWSMVVTHVWNFDVQQDMRGWNLQTIQWGRGGSGSLWSINYLHNYSVQDSLGCASEYLGIIVHIIFTSSQNLPPASQAFKIVQYISIYFAWGTVMEETQDLPGAVFLHQGARTTVAVLPWSADSTAAAVSHSCLGGGAAFHQLKDRITPQVNFFQ